ncbi:hypothetical protein LQ948_07590 [Jiella sp. MQZ9-1]|uniref:Uncharacterized protein n=1 Tax=Jiella flava TaxID=2816857 RepID=A0A939JW41_9HYPH|nr:hypothetical protein [Jiella flava]MBO0662647.1 hypothetical protein [Jiella flava]MCD2471069.1 hypothetical protein [Jiella flava]
MTAAAAWSHQTAGPDIANLAKHREALLILDIDEVVLEFIGPFCALLEEHGAKLHPESFRLTGNVRSLSTGAALSGNRLDKLTDQLYREQGARQTLVAGVAAALKRLSADADIVFLTAMTPAFYDQRRALLDANGLAYPMIATERSKGGVVAELCERWSGPVIFVDDLPPNLEQVHRSAPAVKLLHLMANAVFRPHLPPLPAPALAGKDWPQAETIILRWLTV